MITFPLIERFDIFYGLDCTSLLSVPFLLVRLLCRCALPARPLHIARRVYFRETLGPQHCFFYRLFPFLHTRSPPLFLRSLLLTTFRFSEFLADELLCKILLDSLIARSSPLPPISGYQPHSDSSSTSDTFRGLISFLWAALSPHS